MDVSFRIGDKAVYPAHGVAEVTGIETKEIGGKTLSFYILPHHGERDAHHGPDSRTSRRSACAPSCNKNEVKEVYDILKTREVSVDGQTWNRRYREYMEKIKTGSVFEIAEVLRDLSLLKFDKDLSFGERKMLDTARSLLIKELAVAKSAKEEKIVAELEKIFTC